MPEAKLWFSPKSTRRIIIRSYAGLVGKAPTKQKRLKILVTMPVTGQKVTGYPEWLENAITFVMKTGDPVRPHHVIDYCNVTMSDQNLFKSTPVEAPKAKISHFSVENMASEEDPVTVVKFQMLVAFSTDLLRWCGQMAGEEFDVKFELTTAPEGGEDDSDDESDSEDDPLKGKSDDDEDELEGQKRRREEAKKIREAKKSLSLIQ